MTASRCRDDAIADHMNFLMMAAHDTITSSATSLVMLLGRNPEWQDRLRAEIADGRRRRARLRRPRSARADRLRLPRSAAAGPAGAVAAAPRAEGLRVRRLSHPGRHACRDQPGADPQDGRILARPRDLRPDALHARSSRAGGTNMPGCRSAAARTCASGCTSRRCRSGSCCSTSCASTGSSSRRSSGAEWQAWPDPAPARTACR